MPSTFSPSLRIELIGAGEQAGTWSATTNTNLGTLIENAIAGVATVNVTATNQALVYADGATDQARNAVLRLTTSLGAAFAVYVPPFSKQYTVFNDSVRDAAIFNSTTSGNTTAAGAGVIVPAGRTMTVWSNGASFALQNTNFVGPLTGNVTGNVTGNATTATNVAYTGLTGTVPTWNQSTTGNAATATNVAYTGLTGTVPTWNQSTTGNAATATIATTATTQAFGNNTTAIATTAFVQAALQALHPVGSVYTSTTETNPATLFGFGTWVAFGAGRVLIGNGGGFAAGTTGGSANATLPSHTHTATSTVADPGHAHNIRYAATSNTSQASPSNLSVNPTSNINTEVAVTGISVSTSIASVGSSGTNANLQPYIVVYLWNRTS